MAATTKKTTAAPAKGRNVPVKRTAKKAGASRKTTNGALLSIISKPKKKYPVDLVGQRYQVALPKSSVIMAIQGAIPEGMEDDDNLTAEQMTDMKVILDDVILAVFGATVGETVITRLADPTDDLDYEHIYELVGGLMEVSTENPPT